MGPALGEYLFSASGAGLAFLVAGLLPAVGVLLWPLLPERPPPVVQEEMVRGPLLHPAAFGPGLVILFGLLGFIGFQAYLPLYAGDIDLPARSWSSCSIPSSSSSSAFSAPGCPTDGGH